LGATRALVRGCWRVRRCWLGRSAQQIHALREAASLRRAGVGVRVRVRGLQGRHRRASPEGDCRLDRRRRVREVAGARRKGHEGYGPVERGRSRQGRLVRCGPLAAMTLMIRLVGLGCLVWSMPGRLRPRAPIGVLSNMAGRLSRVRPLLRRRLRIRVLTRAGTCIGVLLRRPLTRRHRTALLLLLSVWKWALLLLRGHLVGLRRPRLSGSTLSIRSLHRGGADPLHSGPGRILRARRARENGVVDRVGQLRTAVGGRRIAHGSELLGWHLPRTSRPVWRRRSRSSTGMESRWHVRRTSHGCGKGTIALRRARPSLLHRPLWCRWLSLLWRGLERHLWRHPRWLGL
jgi:hypothetical protein